MNQALYRAIFPARWNSICQALTLGEATLRAKTAVSNQRCAAHLDALWGPDDTPGSDTVRQ